jgi:hypothetical protein
MSTPAIIVLAIVSLLLLTTLVAFGLGHKRWSWVSVAGSFLVALALGGYLYLASQLLDFEWRWVQLARSTQTKLQEVRDAVRPSAGPERLGRLEPIEGVKSIPELERERDRWQRALERIDNWRGRNWPKAIFEPPSLDGQKPGTITLRPAAPPADGDDPEDPAAGDAEAAAPPVTGKPLDPGATVYVFDDRPAAEGGLYLGGFLVETVEAAEPAGTIKLTVRLTAPPDDYDRAAWGQGGEYESVTVFDQLPSDRWLAFSAVAKSGPATLDTEIAPQPAKRAEEDLVQLVPEPFREEVERHALSAATAGEIETVAEADWPALREALDKGETLPGEVWAELVFESQVDLDAFLGLERDDVAEDESSLSAEAELGKAFELVGQGKATIRKVFRRRRLIDAATLVHGSVVPGGEAGELMADGLAGLMARLQDDIAALDAANERLAESQKNVQAENDIVAKQAAELAADLAEWEKDVAAATKLADSFEAEAERAARRLETLEDAVVNLGQQYDELVRDLVRRIDSVAPPPP